MPHESENPIRRETHPAGYSEERLLGECELTRGRGSGPGGQHRNKVHTLVELIHIPTGVKAHAGERREPEVNKRIAVRRLRLELAVRVRNGVPDGEVGSALWGSRCKNERVSCSAEHTDFPTLLSEALDVCAACGWDVKKASIRLGVSSSQLIKLIAKHPSAFAMVNRERRARSLHALKA